MVAAEDNAILLDALRKILCSFPLDPLSLDALCPCVKHGKN